MFFIVFLYAAYVIIMIRMKTSNLRISNLILPALIFSLILMIDFAVNYATAINMSDNELSIHGTIAHNFFREDNTSIHWFYKYYYRSAVASVLLTVSFAFSILIDRARLKR